MVPNPIPPNLTPKQIERFWRTVDTTNQNGCWPWKGKRKHDYGVFVAQADGWKRELRAHRVALWLTTGEWPEVAMHRCDVRLCCRCDESHVHAGTTLLNIEDRVQKGRSASGDKHGSRTKPNQRPRGERHALAKLTEAIVRSMRHDRLNGLHYRDIATKHGVSVSTTRGVLSYQSWKHVR